MEKITEPMKVVFELIGSLDNLIPNELPVPGVVKVGADNVSELFRSSNALVIPHVNLGDSILWQAMIVVFLQPLIWNMLGRMEYKTRIISKIFFSPRIGIFALALWILGFGIYRDFLFAIAVNRQEKLPEMGSPEVQLLGMYSCIIGFILVTSSFLKLGFRSTFLGDYFGFLLDKKITSFPFNVLENPMYVGSSMSFMGKSILYVVILFLFFQTSRMQCFLYRSSCPLHAWRVFLFDTD